MMELKFEVNGQTIARLDKNVIVKWKQLSIFAQFSFVNLKDITWTLDFCFLFNNKKLESIEYVGLFLVQWNGIMLVGGFILITKKHLIILILKLLETSTDEKTPITQLKIAEIISAIYPCDRKTVGRNIAFLKKIGYPIVKTNKGFYMNTKKFSVEETKYILNAVLSSPEKTAEEKDDIVKRLSDVLNRMYR